MAQTRKSKNKIYSLHEPETECISKGKEHKKYEFGNKVSIIRTASGLIIGAKSFRKEYDGHTIGHLKSDYRVKRNFYKGLVGDAINIMLVAAAYNFKRAMSTLWLYIILPLIRQFFKKNPITQII